MLRRGLSAGAILVLTWWALTGTLVGSWAAGVVAVGLGVGLYLYLSEGGRSRLRLRGLTAFLPYFAWQSMRGGWDVSRRALTPGMPLKPVLFRHELSLPPGPSRIFFTDALSLMPGTVGAELRDDVLVVHLLVGGGRSEARVRELEERVGQLFGPPAR